MKSITVKKIKKVEPIVKRCLEKVPETRDNDTLLILKIWGVENPMLRNKDHSFIEFSKQLLDNQYTSSETITRCRRKLQEKHPELRGEKWKKRHQEQELTRSEIPTA